MSGGIFPQQKIVWWHLRPLLTSLVAWRIGESSAYQTAETIKGGSVQLQDLGSTTSHFYHSVGLHFLWTQKFQQGMNTCVYTVVSRKRAHGQYTLLCAQTGGWVNSCNIAAFYHEKAPTFTLISQQATTGYCTPTHPPSTGLIQFSICISQACDSKANQNFSEAATVTFRYCSSTYITSFSV